MKKGFTARPFTCPHFEPFILFPVGLVPIEKSGKYSLILDLSFPKGNSNSANSFIPREYCVVDYENFDYVTEMMVENGKVALTAKTDIESAFNILLINPYDYWLLGFV